MHSALLCAVQQTFPDKKVAEENKNFIAPTDMTYIELKHVSATVRRVTLGIEGLDQITGVTQLNMRYGIKTGSYKTRQDYELARKTFWSGARLSYNGQEVQVINCQLGPGMVSGTVYTVPITIRWVGYTQAKME